jgi:hypothetical protein
VDSSNINWARFYFVGPDHWLLDTNGYVSGAFKFEKIPFVGSSEIPDHPYSYLRISNLNGNCNYQSIWQPIEDGFTKLAGKTVTLSFWVRSSTGGSNFVSYMFPRNDSGTVGTGNIQSFTLNAGVWTKITRTITVENFTGTVNIRNNYMIVIRTFDQTNGNTFDVANVQVELGDNATPYQYRTYNEDLRLCQRYFTKSYHRLHGVESITQTGAIQIEEVRASNASNLTFSSFPVTMRAIPSFKTYSPVSGYGGQIRDIIGNVDRPFSAVPGLSPNGFSIVESSQPFSVGPNGETVAYFHYSADAEITI